MENLVKIENPKEFWKRFIKSELASQENKSNIPLSLLISDIQNIYLKKYKRSISQISKNELVVTLENFDGDKNYLDMLIGIYTALLEYKKLKIIRVKINTNGKAKNIYVKFK